jgi:hypothetical protein
MARDIKNTAYNVRLDLVNDPSTIKNEEGAMYFYNGKVYYLDGTNPAAQLLDSGSVVTTDAVNHGSTQWSTTPVAPTTLLDGQIANGFTFFTNADKVAGGTTSYDEYSIAFGIDLTLTGTSGTANISVAGVDYLATFNTSLDQTAQDWIAANVATLKALNINVLYNGGSTIRFCANEANCNSVAITTVTGDLNGTRINPFTGIDAAAGDHVLVPYVGKEYEGQRLHHNFRVNFTITPSGGATQTLALSLRRFADDSIIGSEILVFRTADEGAQQFNFISYTNSASDPFVTGGFYFALRNDSGVDVDIAAASVGILIQTYYQKPTLF